MPNRGREKVDFFADCNLGIFGLLAPENTFTGAAVDEKTNLAIRKVLSKFSFPSLNVLFSAAGRLRSKDDNDLKVETKLEEMEARVTLRALDEEGNAIPFDVNGTNSPVSILGLYPFETVVSDGEEPPVQVTPNVPAILQALAADEPAAPPPATPPAPSGFGLLDIAGVISGLGLVFGALFKPRFRILDKAFLAFDEADSNQAPEALVFGWYKRSKGEVQMEGPHYGTVFLQVAREVNSKKVDALEAKIELASDWKGGDVDNQFMKRTRILKLHHPAVPATPIITGSRAAEDLTLTVPGDEVITLLGLPDAEALKQLVASGTLISFNSQDGLQADQIRVTKGSLIDALGVRPAKQASA